MTKFYLSPATLWGLMLWMSVFLPGRALTQPAKGTGFTVAAHVGGIVKHTSKLTFTPPPLSGGVEASVTWHTWGKRDWEAWRRYPILGLSVHAFHLGSAELGQAYAFYPFVDIPLYRGEKARLYFQVGTGVAWLTQRNDRVHNPLQNAIGSHLNNVSALRVHGTWPLDPAWVVTGGLSFTHYSNGQAKIPNFGINVLGGMVGVQWTPVPLVPEDYRPAGIPKTALRRWGCIAHAGMAYKEYFAVGGPVYPVYLGSLAAIWQLSRVNRLYAGVEYEFNQGVATFSKLAWQHDSERERFRAASRVMVFAGEEFMFGDWALLLQAGTYVGGIGELIPFPVYTRLAIRRYLPAWPLERSRFFAGVYLKSHVVTAEYISLGMGMTWE